MVPFMNQPCHPEALLLREGSPGDVSNWSCLIVALARASPDFWAEEPYDRISAAFIAGDPSPESRASGWQTSECAANEWLPWPELERSHAL